MKPTWKIGTRFSTGMGLVMVVGHYEQEGRIINELRVLSDFLREPYIGSFNGILIATKGQSVFRDDKNLEEAYVNTRWQA